MSKHSHIDLMLLADGELEAAEADRLRAEASSDDDARAVMQALDEVGDTVRTYLEVETDRAEETMPAFGQMWSNIERRIQANGHGELADVDEAMPEAASGAASADDRSPAFPALIGFVRRWFSEHRGHFVTGVVAAGAAAAIMFFIRPEQKVIERTVQAPRNIGQVAPASLKSEPPEVENLEVYEGSGMILTIPGEGDDDSSTAVIWISSDNDTVEGPI